MKTKNYVFINVPIAYFWLENLNVPVTYFWLETFSVT